MTTDANASRQDQARLVAALAQPARFDADCERVTVLETHISYVLLTGRFAYKLKKAVDFGFLDFTTLAARRHFCEEELRLNRRLAPALYLDVVPITGSVDAPIVGGDGTAIEHAVQMREFPQEALAGGLLARGEFGATDIDVLAAQVATFHGAIEVAAADAGFGAPDGVLQRAQDNCSTLLPLLDDPVERWEVEALAAWTAREHAARRAAFARRLEEGFVRECHGDLHLGNIARIDGELTIFDCIEFNPALRWIDVMSEVAFTVMDLEDRGRADLSHRFLNAYLERTGEYAGLAVLHFYLVYRALVRAKIARLRTAQLAPGEERSASLAEYHGYVHLARGYAGSPQSAIVITHGLSGSGKTQLSEALLEAIGAVRVRSDVERKRLHGLDPRDRRGAEHGLYAGAATDATYRRLAALTREIVVAGYVAVVDAAFLKRAQRDLLRDLAAKLGVAFVILALPASEATLRERVGRRSAAGSDVSDADLAVLGYQLHTQEPLAPDEEPYVVWYDAEAPLANARAPEAWHAVRERIAHTVWDRRRSP
ncbi:MAG: aminoglycoside phosphotransferase [Betaproteobacteria bacterium]|nr:MAG: aminoglycoside phosphotransferase [Betaproteobacteria bacterium]